MSDIITDAPTGTDDSGTGRDGTRWDAAFYGELLDAINIQVLPTTNPTLTPAAMVDEVVQARGSTGSLDTRLDVSLNEDGTPKAAAFTGYATVTDLLGGIGAVNLVTNDDDLVWPDGDAAAPVGETLAGTGAAVARCGTGLGDTKRKIGDFCAKLTRGTTDASLTHSLLSGAAFTRADFVKSLYAAAGRWVWCATPNVARNAIYDGAGYSYSSYHTGDGTWQWLPVTRQINVAADRLELIRQTNNSAVAAYFSGGTLVLLNSNLLLPAYLPSPVVYGMIHFGLSGTIGAGTELGHAVPSRPGLVKDVQLDIKTAPTGQDLICDVNTYDGGAHTSMFSTRPKIVAGAGLGGAQPDTTYARRCLRGGFGATIAAGARVTLDVDQVGSGTPGSDLVVEVRVLQYQSPLERFWAYTG
jgi:hypothetical protein